MDESKRHPMHDRKVKFKTNSIGSKKSNRQWVVIITIMAFFLSSGLSIVSSNVLENVGWITSFLIVLIIIIIGIVFDTIGIAVTAADESPFHSMASRKLYGAKQAIKLIRNANRVSSVCNDVIGDICGVISGTASAFIIVKVSQTASLSLATIIGLILTGIVASLTIGGKAIGKTIALRNSNYIVYKVSVVISFLLYQRRVKPKQ
ncbi:UNVERIFIED_CONTAM: hypothetical protein Cloal_4446 [Acetivibrio alkalicellulosi]